jgi:hypothetical protein
VARPRALLAALAGIVVLGGCGAESRPPSSDAAPTPSGTSSSSASRPATTHQVSKVLVFVVENHSLDQMRAGMPFTYGQATRYGYADHYQAVMHPSLPNYLAITGGSTYGVSNDDGPSVNGTHAPSVFQQALDHGRTAKTYAEGQPAPCTTVNSGPYAVRHNPWAYHLDERGACAAHDVGLDALADDVRSGSLPDVGLVVPDLCNDAHSCPLATADAWLEEQVGTVEAGPDFTSGHLAVVITADEDDHHQDNTVLTVVAHPALHGTIVSAPLSHYSLSRSLSSVAGAAPLGEAATAPDLIRAFGLRATDR